MIAESFRADLVLVAGNPLEDITNLELRDGVMLRGRWLEAEDVGVMLDDLAARRR